MVFGDIKKYTSMALYCFCQGGITVLWGVVINDTGNFYYFFYLGDLLMELPWHNTSAQHRPHLTSSIYNYSILLRRYSTLVFQYLLCIF